MTQSLAMTTCRFGITCGRAGALPPWKGSMIRGVLGWGLAAGAGAPHPGWPGCRGNLAQVMVEPQAAWENPMAQVPWALQCDDSTTQIPAGHQLCGTLVLLGSWPDWAVEQIREAFATGLERGLGSERLPATMTSWAVSAAGPPADLGSCPNTAQLRLRTPGRFKDRGADLHHLHPPAIVRGLVRRWRQLTTQTTGTDPLDGPRAQALSAACDQLVRIAGEDHPITLERRSNRQDRTHPMEAVGGWCDITGPTLPDLWPWLSLAPWLHVGRQPCFGLGWAEVSATRKDHCTQDQEGPGAWETP